MFVVYLPGSGRSPPLSLAERIRRAQPLLDRLEIPVPTLDARGTIPRLRPRAVMRPTLR